jgi:hypothetical protein
MAMSINRLIFFVVSWWSGIPDLQPNENNEACCEAWPLGAFTIVLVGSWHIMYVNHDDDADVDSPPHRLELPIGECIIS